MYNLFQYDVERTGSIYIYIYRKREKTFLKEKQYEYTRIEVNGFFAKGSIESQGTTRIVALDI